MKKIFTLAMVVALMTTGAAFAANRHYVAQPNATYTAGVGGAAAGPSTTNNDDTCDIGTAPAATLLLPYFQVETSTRGVDTFFTVINTSNLPQIAHVTLWTDWSFPVLDFNLFLTGYDVQPISLYDVIVNGIIAPVGSSLTSGGTSSTSSTLSPVGTKSAANTANPNLNTASCGTLPGLIPPATRAAVASALTTGIYTASGFVGGCTSSQQVGSSASSHPSATTAIGYVTIDVSSVCSTTLPNSPDYYGNEILFDNVLTGDFETLDKTAGSNYAGGNPLVHIRAIPEGGPAGATYNVGANLSGGSYFGNINNPSQTNLPYTFYARFVSNQPVAGSATNTYARNLDRRQPLPSVFAARYIQGGASSFQTFFKIWREGTTGPTSCTNATANSAMSITEIVRFDEHENPNTYSSGIIISPSVPATVTLPETSRTDTAGSVYPSLSSPAGDNAGWMYLNLNSGSTTGGVDTILHPTIVRASQNWVVVSMNGAGSTAGLFGVDFDATWLGNGCSGAVAGSLLSNAAGPYAGPVGGNPICPTGANCVGTTTSYTNNVNAKTVTQGGTNVTP